MEISAIEFKEAAYDVRKVPHVVIRQPNNDAEYFEESVSIPLAELPQLIQKLKEISDANCCNL